MNKLIALIVFAFIAAGVLYIGERLASDAIAMAVGFFFGIVASIPIGALMIAAGNRTDERYAPQPPQQSAGLPPAIVIQPADWDRYMISGGDQYGKTR